MRPRPLEVKALVPLLEQDWETPEMLAEAMIQALDQARTERVSYIGVMQFGTKPPVIYAGVGPYPGMKSAQKAVVSHPAAGEATAIAVVPVIGAQGLVELLRKVDTHAKEAS